MIGPTNRTDSACFVRRTIHVVIDVDGHVCKPAALCHLHQGGVDPQDRLRVMDAEGIDIAVLYCGLGRALGGSLSGRDLAVSCHQVSNDWIADWVVQA